MKTFDFDLVGWQFHHAVFPAEEAEHLWVPTGHHLILSFLTGKGHQAAEPLDVQRPLGPELREINKDVRDVELPEIQDGLHDRAGDVESSKEVFTSFFVSISPSGGKI